MAKSDVLESWKTFCTKLQEKILPLYEEHEAHFDREGIHGRMHVCRAAVFAEWMGRYYLEATGRELDFFAMRHAAAFHDSGRQGNGIDLWESDSARLCSNYLSGRGKEEGCCQQVGSLILKHDPGTMEWQVVQDADILEIMRPCVGYRLEGFRREVLRFGSRRDLWFDRLPADIAVIREDLVQRAWKWILKTEEMKPGLRRSKTYMEDLLSLPGHGLE